MTRMKIYIKSTCITYSFVKYRSWTRLQVTASSLTKSTSLLLPSLSFFLFIYLPYFVLTDPLLILLTVYCHSFCNLTRDDSLLKLISVPFHSIMQELSSSFLLSAYSREHFGSVFLCLCFLLPSRSFNSHSMQSNSLCMSYPVLSLSRPFHGLTINRSPFVCVPFLRL